MIDILRDNPWLIIVCLGLLIPILGVVFGTTTQYLMRIRQAELNASLKEQMLQRGMSAEEIKMVIEAMPRRTSKKCPSESETA